MLTAPKTTSALFTLENSLARFELVEGDDDFEFVGISEAELKGTGTSKVLFNLRSLWEVICVRPTRDVATEHFKVVLPSFATPTSALTAIDGGQRVTLSWLNLLVDGDFGDPDLDRLDVVVELDLLDVEAFLRMRIKATWSVNNPSTDADSGRYAIWRVRFPVIDVTPTSSQSFTDPPDEVGDDALVVPECHGIVVDHPEQRAVGDPIMGTWGPQDRSQLVRNVIRPGANWRQTYPGKISTQVMGYYGKVSGRGVLVGCLDPVGQIKDLEAGAGIGSVWMTVTHVPEWCYTIGNRPAGFTGAQEGDHQDAYLALQSHAPQSEQTLPPLDQQVPDTRSLVPGGEVAPDGDAANAGGNQVGFMLLGFPGATNPNTLANLGYESPFDCVLLPTQGYGPEGWNAIGEAWRDITELPTSPFPLRETEFDPELPLAAAQSTVLLEMDGSVHDGQRSMLGLDDADMPSALGIPDGVVADQESVWDLIMPSEIVAERPAVNDIEVLEATDLIDSRPLLGSDGAVGDIENAPIGEEGRGYLRVFGDDGFYVAPQQIEENDWLGGFQSLGGLNFETFIPTTAGVQIGDVIRVMSTVVLSFDPHIGRANAVVGSDSELYPVSTGGDQARVVVGFGVAPNSLIVGRYVAGSLQPWAFSPVIGNNPGRKFEVEVLRDELDAQGVVPELVNGVVRLQIRIDPTVLQEVYPQGTLDWAEVVEIDGVEYPFRGLFSSLGISYVEFDPQGQEASFFGGKDIQVRRAVAPVDFVSLGVGEGDHLLLGGTEVNSDERVIEFGDADNAVELLRTGYLGFAQPVVPEAAPEGGFTVNTYSPTLAANRLLGPEIDVAAGGFRFVDTSLSGSGGFASTAQTGDILQVTNATLESNQSQFEVVEVKSDFELLVDRVFVTEEDPGGGFTYTVLRRGDVVRDLSRGRRGFRPFRAGPRALQTDGRDRVHFLAIGFVPDSKAPVTGVFGVDSDAWGDLGANPFVPATSINLTTYRVNTRDVRLPSQEFVISAFEGSRITLARGWELEDSNFTATFTDLGPVEFEKNVVQYRIVRDDRAIADVHDWSGSESAIEEWQTALETTAMLAILRGWQPHRLGWDQPGYRPPRGRYLEFLAAQAVRIMSAADIHQERPNDADGLYDEFNLVAASYFNRFGTRVGTAPAGDPAEGESDELLDPAVRYGQQFVIEEVLAPLVSDGITDFLVDHLEEGSRPQFGSPHYFRPLEDLPGDPTTFEVTEHGGGPSFAEGWRRILALAAQGYSVTTPMDWLLGTADFSTRDWGDIDHTFPDVELVMPVDGALENPVGDLTVIDLEVFLPGTDFSQVTAEMYGEDQVIEEGDLFELLPSGTRHVIVKVDEALFLESSPDLTGEVSWRVLLRRNFAEESVNAPSFFHFAFGEYATLAADVTFLANDISWAEVVEQRGTGITLEQYTEAVTQAYSRAMYRSAVGTTRGLLPSVKVESEGDKRVPPFRYDHQFNRPGTSSLPEQVSTSFPVGVTTFNLIGTYQGYLRSLARRMDEVKEWVRFGPSEQAPSISGATSRQVHGVQMSPGRRLSVVQGSAFADEDGDLIFILTHWAPAPIGDGLAETVTLSWNFSERGITTGYWAMVEVIAGAENALVADVVDISVAPGTADSLEVLMTPLQTRIFLLYQQDVIVRLNKLSIEVDRVLVVPIGRSVAVAFATIALDVVKGGSGNYVVVVGEGAILDGLDVPSIPGATIEMQRSPDENPEIGEVIA